MRVLENLKIGKSVKYRIKEFESLPDRAKEIMFAAMDDLSMKNDGPLGTYWAVAMGDYLECESPIEKILYVAVDLVFLLRKSLETGILLFIHKRKYTTKEKHTELTL